MRLFNWKTVSTLVAMGAVAGCQDGAVSAPASAVVAPTSMMLAPAGRPSLALSGGSFENGSSDFTVSPNGGTYYAGNHAVVFPAQSICDPATSSYGIGTWDQPCTPLTTSLKVHAEVRAIGGLTWVDFTPALRFVPSANPSRWVWIYMYTPGAVNTAGDLSRFNILYASSIGGATVDEAAADPTQRTYVDTRSGLSVRRIKHFSGYVTSSGRSCDPAVDDDCYPVQGGQQ